MSTIDELIKSVIDRGLKIRIEIDPKQSVVNIFHTTACANGDWTIKCVSYPHLPEKYYEAIIEAVNIIDK